MAWKVQCSECGRKESFGDAKDVTYAKWRIIAWLVPSGEPKAICPECKCGKSKPKDK